MAYTHFFQLLNFFNTKKEDEVEMATTITTTNFSFQPVFSAFIENFNYLGKDGKRKGFLFFNNSDLTEALEKKAIEIKQKTTTINNTSEKLETEKMIDFLNMLENYINKVKKVRIDKAELQYEYIVNNQNNYTCIAYKNPYQPGGFESELVAGLNAIKTHLIMDDKLKVACLIKTINSRPDEWQIISQTECSIPPLGAIPPYGNYSSGLIGY
jgi:hypothetical protein